MDNKEALEIIEDIVTTYIDISHHYLTSTEKNTILDLINDLMYEEDEVTLLEAIENWEIIPAKKEPKKKPITNEEYLKNRFFRDGMRLPEAENYCDGDILRAYKAGEYNMVNRLDDIKKLAEIIKQIPLEQLCQSNVYPLLNLILEKK